MKRTKRKGRVRNANSYEPKAFIVDIQSQLDDEERLENDGALFRAVEKAKAVLAQARVEQETASQAKNAADDRLMRANQTLHEAITDIGRRVGVEIRVASY